MNTITLIVHDRPVYTAKAISALAEALLKPTQLLGGSRCERRRWRHRRWMRRQRGGSGRSEPRLD